MSSSSPTAHQRPLRQKAHNLYLHCDDATSSSRRASGLRPRIDLDAGARGASPASPWHADDSPARISTALAGTSVALKAECLQVTGSFKLRGALSKVAALGDRAAAGLLTASAGNHARAVAHAARAAAASPARCSCRATPPSRRSPRSSGSGRMFDLEGDSVEEALELAAARPSETGAALVHPFDDLDVIAGQGTLGLELLEDGPRPRARARAGRRRRPGQRRRHRAAPRARPRRAGRRPGPGLRALRRRPAAGARPRRRDLAPGATIADGIAIKRPGGLTLPLLRELLDGLETVSRGRDRRRDGVPRRAAPSSSPRAPVRWPWQRC